MATVKRLVSKVAKLLRLLPRKTYWVGLREGVAASVEHRAVALRADYQTVVDIGANRGQFALFARERFPASRVVSIEPQLWPHRKLERLAERLGNVRVHRGAVAPEAREMTLHVSAADDSSSLLPMGRRQIQMFPDTREIRTELVEAAPLSAFIDPSEVVRPCLIKIDVQGFELGVLRGSEDFLALADTILVEGSFQKLYEGQPLAGEIVAYMNDRGFAFGGIFNLLCDAEGNAVQADFVFWPHSDAESGVG